ncbi:DUF2162 family putative transporter [Methanobacterium alcaliphilum]|uniref:DUF2162 family putative transporter n=1 Tax=Methanobacterium alcaliphilum TaxID=392018 RepID=UPI00200B1272|nr:DUF2162 family putative transporter [Methanobacterium alcaliphilum]MCK9151889.1 DUF2162 domain-containing protein [Methanobacterium alcaliphilum]
MSEIIWEFLIISVITLLAINIGLAMGLSRIEKKKALVISITYCLFIFLSLILTCIILQYVNLLYPLMSNYISIIMALIGFLLIIGAILTISGWKKNKKEYTNLKSPAIVFSFVCCFLGIISNFILLSKSTIFSSFEAKLYILGPLLIVIIIFFLFSKFLRKAESPYPLVIANYMTLNGLFFIIAAIFIPNINSLSNVQTNPLVIKSTSSLFFLFIAGIGILLLGVFLHNRSMQDKHEKYNIADSEDTIKENQ